MTVLQMHPGILHPCKGVAEDSSLLGCVAELLNTKDVELLLFKTSATTNPTTWHHIPEHFNLLHPGRLLNHLASAVQLHFRFDSNYTVGLLWLNVGTISHCWSMYSALS
jgi:hypothetical protein